MDFRKENDSLYEIEEKERLTEDIAYIRNIKNNIRNTFISNYENLKKEYIKNTQLKPSEILVINRFVEFLKNKA